MKKYVNGEYVELTQEEIEEMEEEQQKQEAYELHRQLSQNEVLEILIKQQINTLQIDDKTSLKMKSYYPTFEEVIGQEVKQGFKFTYQDKLYKTIAPDGLVIQEQYPPSIHTASLYEVINETHLGNQYDPIPYEGNMTLEKDKYYTQYGVMYLCHLGSGSQVFNDLKDLVHLYITVVNCKIS